MFRFLSQSMWDLIIHPPSGPSVLVVTRSLLQSMWDPPNPPLAGTPPRVYSPSGLSFLLAHRSVSGSDILCNGPSQPLAHIVHGLPLKVFKTRLLEWGFHTVIKNASFSSPTHVESHQTYSISFAYYFLWSLWITFDKKPMASRRNGKLLGSALLK